MHTGRVVKPKFWEQLRLSNQTWLLSPSLFRAILLNLAIGLIYFCTARLALLFSFQQTNASPFWPPAGIALAALFLVGPRAIPGIVFGAFAANGLTFISNGNPLSWNVVMHSLMITFGNASGSLVAWWISGLTLTPYSFCASSKSIFRFLLGAATASIVAALIGASVVVYGGNLPSDLWLKIFRVWSIGDFGGIITVTPMILCWSTFLANRKRNTFWLPYLILFSLTTLQILKVGQNDWLIWILPLAPLAAILTKDRQALWTTVNIALAVLIWQTIKGHGPFAQDDENAALLHIQFLFPLICLLHFVDSAWLRRSETPSKSSLVELFTSHQGTVPRGVIVGIFISLIGTLFTLVVFKSFSNEEEKQFLQSAHAQSKVQANFFVTSFEGLRANLDRLTRATEYDGVMNEGVWKNNAKYFVADMNFIQAFEWVDSNGYVRWIEPMQGNSIILGQRLNTDSLRGRTMDLARKNHLATATRLLNLKQGGVGFLLYSPIQIQNQHLGYNLVVTRMDTLIRYLQKTAPAWNRENYETCILAGDSLVFSTLASIRKTNLKAYTGTPISVLGEPIVLYAIPTADFLIHHSRKLSAVALNVGLLLSVLIGGCIAMAGMALESARSAQAASKVKAQFLATMSHEIRTPMNGILGSIELALTRPLDAEVREHLNTVDQSGHSLLAIINDVLDFSKIESGKMTVEKLNFNLKELIQNLNSIFINLSQQKGLKLDITLSPQVPEWVVGDPLRLRQVLSNLLSNAIKFTEKGHVSLRVESVAASGIPIDTEANPILRFSCRDSGIGMTENTQKHLFSPFQQGDASTSRKFGGTGLGLTISRDLIELMGGSITCTSSPGEGSTFTLEVPMPKGACPVIPNLAMGSSGTPISLANSNSGWVGQSIPRRVLLAEDNIINQRIATMMLRRLNCLVTLADTGTAAVSICRESAFDMIFMDLQMPEMDGTEATRIIRASLGPNQKTPIIALTANAFIEDREACLASGMNHFISKPVTLSEFARVLKG